MIPVGATAAGPVHAIDLAAGDLAARILTRGATLRAVHLRGVERNLTVGDDDLALYEGPDGPLRYHGALVAPVANRLRGARAAIDGTEHRFEANDGPNTLHSAGACTAYKLWDVLEEEAHAVLLGVTLPDGEGGFPGTRRVTARFSALAPATLRLEVLAITDAPTLFNAANHSYWNLDGTPTWEGHELTIHAEGYTPVDAALIPVGEAPVAGTPYDFRAPRRPRPGKPPMDHNFCTARARGPLREVMTLRGRDLSMTLSTTEPGLQVYDGSQGARPGAVLHEALAIEAQSWPDAPANPSFPQVALRPGEVYRQVTEWRFSR